MEEEEGDKEDELWEVVCIDEETVQLDIHWIVEYSGYLSGLMRSDMRETKQRKLNLCYFSAEIVAFMVQMFTCRTKKQSITELEDTFENNFSFSKIEELLQLIDYLDIPCLYQKSSEMLSALIPNFCVDICKIWKLWLLCDMYNLESVERQLSSFLVKKFKDFVEIDHLFLKELPVSLLIGMLSADNLDVKSESEVMWMIEAWIDYNRDQRLQYFDELFKCVHIPSLLHSESKEIEETVKCLTGSAINLGQSYIKYVNSPHAFYTEFPHMKKARNSEHVIITFGGIYDCSIRNYGVNMNTRNISRRRRLQSLPMFYSTSMDFFETKYSDKCKVNHNGKWKRFYKTGDKNELDMKQFPGLKSPVELVEFGACTFDGFVYVMGGQRQMNDTAKCSVKGGFRLDPNIGEWHEVKFMNERRCLFPLCAIWGRIYAIGGANQSGILQSTEYYLPLDDIWKMGPDLHRPLHEHAGCVLKNSIYISGGHNDIEHTDKVWFLDNEDGPWKPAAPLLRSRSYHAMAALNDKLYVVGGATLQQNGIQDIYSVEEYDPKTDMWTNIMQLNVPVGDCKPLIMDHHILIVGGYSFSEKVCLQQAVSIDTEHRQFKVIAVTFHSKCKQVVGYSCVNVKLNRKFLRL